MRLTHKLMLLAVTAIAAMAMSAASASALSVKTESTGVACSAVSKTTHGTGSGGCLVHATSVGTVELSAFGIMITCNMEVIGRLNGTASGTGTTSSSRTAAVHIRGAHKWPERMYGRCI